ncbi:dihydrodipicolinate synthase family protein [Actinophytocola sp.]|uniref:dihydrodipicolinate synthase family protein n=1 Tax=Actinophytocola sp. TaxID=1872138 RepID=UPI0025C026B8|nr:dihydrodipicolinate synthase family protein [Actinophytocola sp.]
MRLPAGSAVALATPVDKTGRLDRDGLARLVRHVLAGGVKMVCPVGSTGEGARLSTRQRAEVTAEVRALVPREIPIVSGVASTSFDGTLAGLSQLHDAGATAALVSPPSYFPMTEGEVGRFYERLAAAPLPIVLYNIPQFSSVALAPPVVATLAAHPAVIGIKDSSRDMEYLLAVLDATENAANFRVFTGTDTLLVASLVSGADGAIAASANVCPAFGGQICEAVAEGDLDRALSVQRRLTAVVRACRRGTPPAGWKAALEIIGICAGNLVEPGSRLSAADHAALAGELAALGLPETGR